VRALDALASCLEAKGDDQEVEQFRLRALAILERAYGPDHPYLVLELWVLGRLYHQRGMDQRAEPLLLRAVAIGDEAMARAPDGSVRDPRHLYALAELYQDQGDYARAEPLLVRALAFVEDGLACRRPCRPLYPVGHPPPSLR
jgi:tetratricopeptide (TPR) repeat protein